MLTNFRAGPTNRLGSPQRNNGPHGQYLLRSHKPGSLLRVDSPRVAQVTQWFPPEPEGPEFWVAEQLAKRGIRPVIVTANPNYPTGRVYDGYQATGRIRESYRGFTVQRCPVFPSRDSSALKRFATYGSFAASSSWFGRRILASADVTFVYSSPAPAASAAIAARVLHGTPYVLWVQDLWPDTIFATGFLQDGPLRRAAEWTVGGFTQTAYRLASHIAVITPGMRDLLIQRGVPGEKVSVVYNWVDESVMRPVPPIGTMRHDLGIPDHDIVLMYAGGHGLAQRLQSWVTALAQVRDLPDLHLVFVGDGPEKAGLVELATSLDLRNAHFLPRVDRREVVQLIAESDAQVISLADDPLFDITLPSKTQSSLACAKPIVASLRGDLAEILRRAQAGWVAEPENPESIAGVMRMAHETGREGLRRMGVRGRDYYLKNMSEDAGGAALAAIVREAAAKG